MYSIRVKVARMVGEFRYLEMFRLRIISCTMTMNWGKHTDAFMCVCLELMRGPVGQIICGERDLSVMEKNKLLMPPLWNTYFCWGYYDNSCSFGNYTTEKVFIHFIQLFSYLLMHDMTDWLSKRGSWLVLCVSGLCSVGRSVGLGRGRVRCLSQQ